MNNDEKQLVKKITSGDTRAFREFVDRYKKLVAHIVFRMVRNPVDREDLCQDVFVKAYQNLQGFQFHSKISTWLARIAYNTCVNYVQKKKIPLLDDSTPDEVTMDDFAAPADDPHILMEESETSSNLQRMIDALPVVYRTVVTLYHLDGMKYAEIAEVMGMPEGTIKSYLFRARSMLKDKLKTVEEFSL